MHKILKVLLIVILILIVFLLICYINHRINLNKEKKLLNATGTTVDINNHKMNIYISGNLNSKYTLVFMSGAGTCSPILDFKTLFTQYEDKFRIVVVEKAGYGYSEDSDVSRDIDTMLYETRTSLTKAGIENKNLILFPHSMSGIEALYWANKYPEEIKAIIGLDPAVPASYSNMKINKNALKIVKFGVSSGLVRLIPSIVDSSAAIKYGKLNNNEKEIYRAIFYRKTMSKAMLNEIGSVKENAKKLEKIDNTKVPMLLFISNGEGTGYSKDEWHKLLIDYSNKEENRSYILLDSSHYVHDIEYKKIYEESLKFIKKESDHY